MPHSSHWTVSPSSTSSTSTTIGLSHSGHTTAMTPSSMGSFAHPPIGFTYGIIGTANSRTPCYLFSGLPAHSSSIRWQQHFGFHIRRIFVNVRPLFLSHFSCLTFVPALLAAGLLHA